MSRTNLRLPYVRRPKESEVSRYRHGSDPPGGSHFRLVRNARSHAQHAGIESGVFVSLLHDIHTHPVHLFNVADQSSDSMIALTGPYALHDTAKMTSRAPPRTIRV